MRAGGQTTVIQRVLERRAQQPPTIEDDTASTIAVMLRCLPPPRALLAIGEQLVAPGPPSLERAHDLDRGRVVDRLHAAHPTLRRVVECHRVLAHGHVGLGDGGEANAALIVGVLLAADPPQPRKRAVRAPQPPLAAGG